MPPAETHRRKGRDENREAKGVNKDCPPVELPFALVAGRFPSAAPATPSKAPAAADAATDAAALAAGAAPVPIAETVPAEAVAAPMPGKAASTAVVKAAPGTERLRADRPWRPGRS
jgi:hypothetical protein